MDQIFSFIPLFILFSNPSINPHITSLYINPQGIITEVGVAEAAADAGTDGIIDMAQFLRSKGMSERCNKVVNPTAMPSGFVRLDEVGIAEYIVRLPR